MEFIGECFLFYILHNDKMLRGDKCEWALF